MPAALERKLKRQVAGKKMSKERKDAYVYGTLRKTGWKPSREKKMNIPNSRLIRLAKIDNQLDSIIQFQTDDDQDPDQKKRSLLGAAGLVGVGAGGVLGHQAIQRAGGYGVAGKAIGGYAKGIGSTFAGAAQQAGAAGGSTFGNVMAGTRAAGAQVGQGIGKVAGSAWKGAGQAAGSAWQNIVKKLGIGATKALESKEKPIEFSNGDYSEDPIEFGQEILGPWQGKKGHESKIDQYEFPAGLSPAAVLKFPFPKLMAYLNRRNILQQVYSSKMERLIELNSRLDEIQFQSPWVEHREAQQDIMERLHGQKREAKKKFKVARREYKEAEYGVHPELEKINRKLRHESYVQRGAGVGTLGGALAGGAAGAHYVGGDAEDRLIGGLVGAGGGAIVGGLTGARIGGEIRRKKTDA